MTSPSLNVAVIGAGYFGCFHAEKLARLPGVRLTAVVDVDLVRARAIADPLGIAAFADAAQIEGPLDAVTIAAPSSSHFALARHFLERNVHCFVEKPIATTTAEATALIALAARRNLVLQVGHIQRVPFEALGVRALVAAPRLVEAVRIAPYRPRATDVGVVLDLMIHDIDLALALLGDAITDVTATGGCVISPSEDYCSARVRFASGATAAFTASRVSPRIERELRIYGPAGHASIDLQQRRAVAMRKGDDGTLTREERSAPAGDDLAAELAAFAGSIMNGGPPLVSGEDGRAALDVALRVLACLARD